MRLVLIQRVQRSGVESIFGKDHDGLMGLGDEAVEMSTARIDLYGDLRDEVLRTEYLLAQLDEVGAFVVVDADEERAVVGEEVSRQLEPRIDHRQPVGVEPPVGLDVGDQAVAGGVGLAGLDEVVSGALAEVVVVDEIVASVVRRIDVDHLDPAEIGLL